jgi:hypothetical protein
MLTRLSRGLRRRAAMILAALYALCAVAPGLTIAFASGAATAHCLTDDHHGLAHVHGQDHVQGKPHIHADGSAHEHADDAAPAKDGDDPPIPTGACCGLFCFSAVTVDHAMVERPVHASRVLPVPDEALDGRGPDRINRPPISLLSL